MQPTPTYRPDIDGLRAIAVLLVVAMHLHIAPLAGGFIGVDVFFVISGYLITTIILRDTFSLLNFYERRIRRIFPALIVMLAATIPFAWHYLLPGEMATYARSLLAAITATSNFIFWGWHGYFDQTNDLKPLLHTWSLGVEEQFYLLFPLALILLTTLTRKRRTIIWTLTFASFLTSCILVRHNPHSAFFMITSRAWELLLGAIVSQHYLPQPRSPLQRNLASATGLALILIPAAIYTAETSFPGLAALPPCIGAALILAAGETGTSLTTRLLSLKPLTFIGLISYSLYLWHWPIQVFYTFHHMQTCTTCDAPETLTTKLLLFAASIAIATLSWRFVETPFRTGPLRPTRTRLFLINGTAGALISAAAIAIIVAHGEPSRFSPASVQAATYLDLDTYQPWRWGVCALGLDNTSLDTLNQQRCLPFTPGKRHYLLLGDSHAAHLWPGLSTVFPTLEIGQINVAGCNLLPNTIDHAGTCGDISRYLYRDLLPSHAVDTLIISALWHDNDLPEIARLVDYTRTHNIKLILIGPNLTYDLPLPRLLARSPQSLQSHTTTHDAQLDTRLRTAARDQWHINYISFFDNLCPQTTCPAYAAPGIPMLLETNHLTPEASILFAQTIQTHHQLP